MKNNHSPFCPYCPSLQDEIMRQHKGIMQKRSAVTIAQHLCFVLRIKPGKELVLFLGKGNERDNQSAVATWVLTRLQKLPTWPMPQDESKQYVKELESELMELLQEVTLDFD